MKIVLIMGLPGSGKTTLAKELVPLLEAKWLNADKVRTQYNDWDFSADGRVRQANRMRDLAKKLRDLGNYVVADFVCPTKEARKLFGADFTIWMDTIEKGRFDGSAQTLRFLVSTASIADSLALTLKFKFSARKIEKIANIYKEITLLL